MVARFVPLLALVLALHPLGAQIRGPVQPGDTTDHVDLKIGATAKLAVDSGVPTWSSGNPSVASVSVKGVVTAKARGYATITATVNGVKFTTRACVTAVDREDIGNVVATIKVQPARPSVRVGTSQSLSVLLQLRIVGPTTWGQCVHWTAGPGSLVSRTGLVTVLYPATSFYAASSLGMIP